MSEREEVLLTALDEATEAREGTYFQLDYPTERDHAIKQYAEAREAIRRALTPAPRVVVTEAMREAGARALCEGFRVTHFDGDEYAPYDGCSEEGKNVWRGLANLTLTAALTEAPADGA
jgi:hypothetical protein